jgi:hypothetical protein
MAEWPISISEAARRLDIPFITASILVTTHEIPTIEYPYQPNFKGLDEAAFERLRVYAAKFPRRRRRAALSA